MRFLPALHLLLLVAPSGALTWEECVSAALSRNPDLAASRGAREAGRADYRGSFNAFLPQVSLSNAYADSRGAGGLDRWTGKASASMSLVDLGKTADIRSSAASLASAEAQLRRTSADLRLALRQAFLKLLFAQEGVEVSRRVEAIRRRGADLVTLRYNSGRESRGNMLRAQAQMEQALADLRQADREVRVNRSVLGRQLGEDDYRVLAASGTLSAGQPPGPPEDAREWLRRRPEIAVSEAALRSAQAGRDSAKSALWPSLAASYSRAVSDREEFPSRDYGWSFSGTLSYPLFGGGPTAAYQKIAAADFRLKKAEEDLRAVRLQAMAEIEGAWTDYARAVDLNAVQASLLAAARQRGDEADIRYASGLMSYDNWEIINTDRVNQERQGLQARLNAGLAEASWSRALGAQLGE